MPPAVFKDITKPVQDLLSNDYVFQAQKFKVKTKSANGVELTTEGTLKGSKGVSAKLTAKFSPIKGVTVNKLCVTTDGRFLTETSVEDVMPGMTLTVKAEEGAGAPPSGELCVDYLRDNANVSASVDMTNPSGPSLYGSTTLGYENLVIGGEVKCSTGKEGGGAAALTDYNGCLSYTQGDLTATVSTKQKASVVSLGLHQKYSKDVTIATDYNHYAKLLTVGAIYKVDSSTTFQGKADSQGTISCNAIQVISAGVKLITSVELDAKNFSGDNHKFGMSLILG